ncbi:MAG: inositol 2-dehydrogenase [Chloroflexi bacterium]|nr:inositol 2-dehydrogenase [Chloroflexota bacterium]
MSEHVSIGLIGAGRIGRVHAKNIRQRIPQARLLAVADVFEEAAQRAAADFDIPAAHADPRFIFDDPAIDAVVICSSTDTHAQFIRAAAEAGKHIFCEKPIHLELTEIDKALAAVEKAGVKLQIGFNRRFDPSFKRARDLVASGRIGEPHLVRITSRDPEPPPIAYIKVSGGIFLDMTIHDFDMARFLMGQEVTEVYATGGVMIDPAIGEAGDIDTALITLKYENGVLGSIDNSRKAVYGYDQRVEVFGSRGVVVVSNKTPDNAVVGDSDGFHAPLPLFFFIERYGEAYVEEMQAFVDSVLKDKTPPVTGIDGRIPVVMGYAAWKSYRENRPVKLEEIEKKHK